jgi:hypothetical protein
LAARLATALCLALLLWRAASGLAPVVTMPWFNMSDENVIAGEVIRFAGGDFRQQYFDMPGTPLMLLGAAQVQLWRRASGGGQDISTFAFAHMQGLMELLRVDSLVFFLISILLLYVLAARLTNRYAALAACTLYVYNEAYANTVASLRVEPTATALLLGGLALLTGRALRPPAALAAGLLGGIAVGCRMHAAILVAPLYVLTLWMRTRNGGGRYSRASGWAAAASGLAAFTVAVWGWSRLSGPQEGAAAAHPLATAFLANASLGAALAIAAAFGLYGYRRTRRLVTNAIGPEFLLMAAGGAAGFLATTFTIFEQWPFFLRSIHFYRSADYQDPAVVKMALLDKLGSLFSFYLGHAAPDRIAAVLLAAGVATVAFHPRWRRLWPYLAAACLFFVSRPLDLQRARHHIAMWIPVFAILAAVGVAALIELAERRAGARRYWVWAAACAGALLLPLALTNGVAGARDYMLGNRPRLQNIERSREWIGANLPKGEEVQLAFYCFGPETFYTWFRGFQVPTPGELGSEYRYGIWWGRLSSLKGREGYACLSPALDPPHFLRRNALGADGVDPPRDPRFRLLQAFGKGDDQVAVYRFDMR